MIILLDMKAVVMKYLSFRLSGINFYLYHHRAVSSMNSEVHVIYKGNYVIGAVNLSDVLLLI